MSAPDRIENLKVGLGDTATAQTELPLSSDAVFAYIADIQRLVRLNPHLAIERWIPAEWGFRFAGCNESNDQAFEVSVLVEIAPDSRSITMRYDAGLKQATVLRVEPSAGGARLVVTEHYPRIGDKADPCVAEVDRSLVPWVAAIRRHLLARRRWSWLPGWNWWTERFMLALPPRQRRIVQLIVWVSAIEFMLFFGLVAVLRYAA